MSGARRTDTRRHNGPHETIKPIREPDDAQDGSLVSGNRDYSNREFCRRRREVEHLRSKELVLRHRAHHHDRRIILIRILRLFHAGEQSLHHYFGVLITSVIDETDDFVFG